MDGMMNVPLVGASACVSWLVALVLIVVGVLPVRKAHAASGYLMAAAGASLFGRSCCWSLPTAVAAAGQYELLEPVSFLALLGGGLLDALTLLLVLASLALLARAGVAQHLEAGARS